MYINDQFYMELIDTIWNRWIPRIDDYYTTEIPFSSTSRAPSDAGPDLLAPKNCIAP
jgi:hypothetical protein